MGTKNNNQTELFSHLSTVGFLPRWIVLLADILLSVAAFYAAYYLAAIYNDKVFEEVGAESRMAIVMVFQIGAFMLFHTYASILRYSTYADAMRLLAAVSATVVCCIAAHFFMGYVFTIDPPLFLLIGILLYGVFDFLLLFALRLSVKMAFDYFVISADHKVPVLVYGTRAAGVGIGKMIRSTNDSKFKLMGFIEDGNKNNKVEILGKPVYSRDNEKKLLDIFRRRQIKAVVLSPWKMREIQNEKELDFFLNNDIQVLVSPLIESYEGQDAQKTKTDLARIKSIQIEDLLNRRQISINQDTIKKQIANKVILVSGAAGSIGSEIARQLTAFKPKMLILLDQAETPLHNLRLELQEKFPELHFMVFVGDVRDEERMDFLFSTYRPNIVYHAAAYKHVPMMEDNPSESILTNVLGTKNMADLAVKYGVLSFVMVSTDKAVNPTNIMGASKRIAEIYVQSLFDKLAKENAHCTKFITTRFGNVLGSNGSVIPLFRHQIERGGPLTVTHPDIIRYFMTIPEACLLVLEAGSMGNGGEILIFDMGEPVKIVDLARRMIKLAGFVPDVDIKIKFTGLRPGEKLFEELLASKENTIASDFHDKIMVAKVRKSDYDAIFPNIQQLISLAHAVKDYAVVEKMKEIVPEFISQNSPYEVIDLKNKIHATTN